MPKVITNGMKWAFVALTCLECVAAAGDPSCFDCGCKTRVLHVLTAEGPGEHTGVQGDKLLVILNAGGDTYSVYDECQEAKFPRGENVQKDGICGVGGAEGPGISYCAGCGKDENGIVHAIYADKCPSDACKCIWEGKTLPEEAWVAPDADATTGRPIGAGNPLTGTYCRDWNILPGVVDHVPDTTCPKSKMCTPACNWLQNAWCYVQEGCTTHPNTLTSVETLRPYGAAWSYELCGSANCYTNVENGEFNANFQCPEGPGCEYYRHCECLFEGTTLPASVSNIVGNPLYGTHCEIAWDLLPGTKSYTEQPECMEGKKYEGKDVDPDKCSKECNWHYNHFCYVEMHCSGLAAEHVILSAYTADLVTAAAAKYPGRTFINGIGYSYEMCGSGNCYGSAFDTNPDCPFGEDCLTCGMVKHDYKVQDCCHQPANAIQIHHVFHEGMDSSLHEGDQNWKLPNPMDKNYGKNFVPEEVH